MKRIVSLVLALSMVLSMFTFSFAGLKDVDNTKYESAVEALVELGVVAGYPDGTFLPEKVVTRAELAKLLVTAYGLEAAAEVAVGPTAFGDVAADHWASGYINVAADYGFVNGYPDGTFAPDNTVSYAEAVTMCLRVLGYTNEIESKGTWPTNYMSKAQDLKMMRDIDFKSYNDGATRGNTAILIWNMLRTKMWEIHQESEGDGLVSWPDNYMITVKFSDYIYFDEEDEVTIKTISVEEDGKVEITFSNSNSTYLLKGGDLLRLVPGMKVAGLICTEDSEEDGDVLTLTCVDTLVEGRVDEKGKINDKAYTGIDSGDADKYMVIVVDGKLAKYGFELPEEDPDELDEDEIEDLVDDDEDEEVIYLLGDEWLTVNDLKVGDVITKVKDLMPTAGELSYTGTFYAVSRDTIEGEYNGYVTDKNGDKFVKIDGEKIAADDITVYEYNEKKEEYKEISVNDIKAKDNKYLDEETRIVLDYLGNAVNMYFDEVNKNTASSINFYIEGNSWQEASKNGIKHYMELTDVNGDVDDYEVSADIISGEGNQSAREIVKYLTAEALDKSDDSVDPELLLGLVRTLFEKNDVMKDAENNDDYLYTDEDDAVAEWYMLKLIGDEELLDEEINYISGDFGSFKVGADTVVVTLKPVIDDHEVTDLEVIITEGPDALKGVTNAIIVTEVRLDDDDSIIGPSKVVSYAFVAEDAKSAELNFGLVTEEVRYEDTGVNMIEIDNEEYKVASVDAAAGTIVEGGYVAWTTDEKGKISIKAQLRPEDISDACVITEVEGFMLTLSGDSPLIPADKQLDVEETVLDNYLKDIGIDLDDVRFFHVDAKLDKQDDGSKLVKFISTDKAEYNGLADVDFAARDRVQLTEVNGETLVVLVKISGLKDDSVINAGYLAE